MSETPKSAALLGEIARNLARYGVRAKVETGAGSTLTVEFVASGPFHEPTVRDLMADYVGCINRIHRELGGSGLRIVSSEGDGAAEVAGRLNP